ncbi:MAG: FHA domain-containing protein [Planctomycetota bacterium]
MTVELELVHRDGRPGQKVRLRKTAVVGRGRKCQLRIPSKQISRKHCCIFIDDGPVRVRDLGSSNGTFVDSDIVNPGEDVPLLPESKLSIGGVKFFVRYDPTAASDESVEDSDTVAVPRADMEQIARGEAVAASADDSEVFALEVNEDDFAAQFLE